MQLLDFFPYETPRDSQKTVLEKIQKHWSSTDVFVIRVPVAGGKSALATTIQDYALQNGLSAGIIVPSNNLRDQFMREFDWLVTIKAQEEYWLPRFRCNVKQYMQRYGLRFGPKGCQYNEDRKLVRRKDTPVVSNYMALQAHKLQRNVLIVDEAHQLLATLQSMNATKFWQHQIDYPSHLSSVQDLLLWLEGQPNSPKLNKLREALKTIVAGTVVEFSSDYYRGEMMPCIKLLPLSVADAAPVFWPKKTQKIVLMSATINESDIANMGLATRKVIYLDAESEIPQENRPIKTIPIGSMSRKNKGATMPLLVKEIQSILNSYPNQKGFIHATYELAELLRTCEVSDRLIFHRRHNKQEQFQEFMDSDPSEGKVFVGSGMYEGVDLKDDLGRFQIITKVPFKSLANPSYRFLAQNNPEQYIWLTSRDLLQASGRICRTPTDTGTTFILDSDIDLWYSRAREYNQVPSWFKLEEK